MRYARGSQQDLHGRLGAIAATAVERRDATAVARILATRSS